MNDGVSVTSGLADAMLAQSAPAEHLEVTAVECSLSRSKGSQIRSNSGQIRGQIVGHIGGHIVKMLNKLPEPQAYQGQACQGGYTGK